MAEDFQNPVNQVIKRAWTDADFRQRLCDDPREVLKEYDIDIEAPDIEVHLNTPQTKHLIIPELPAGEEMTDADLERLVRAGATCAISKGFFGTCL